MLGFATAAGSGAATVATAGFAGASSFVETFGAATVLPLLGRVGALAARLGFEGALVFAGA